MPNGADVDVLKLVGDHVAAPAELFDRGEIVVRRDDLLVGDLPARRVFLRIERYHAIAHALCVERKHAAELSSADDADGFDDLQSSELEAAASCIRRT